MAAAWCGSFPWLQRKLVAGSQFYSATIFGNQKKPQGIAEKENGMTKKRNKGRSIDLHRTKNISLSLSYACVFLPVDLGRALGVGDRDAREIRALVARRWDAEASDRASAWTILGHCVVSF